jgi:hypothetical protein
MTNAGDNWFGDTEEELSYFGKPKALLYIRPFAVSGSYWGNLVAYDLKWLWFIRRTLDHGGFGAVLRQFISNSPYRDISLLTWCATILGWWEYGIKMVWLTAFSFIGTGILRAIIQAPRPFEFDRRLRPLADRQMTSYGCPSIESVMAVVTYGYIGNQLENPVWMALSICMMIFVGLTRIYAGSRFVHQVMVSWLIGAAILSSYLLYFEPKVPHWGEDLRQRNLRLGLMVPWAVAFVVYISLAIEDNSSNLFRLPNSEFIRVMTDIMDSGASAGSSSQDASPQAPTGPDGDNDDPLLHRYQNQGLSLHERRRRKLASRQDSFYFLQHSMRSKDLEAKSYKSQQPAEDERSEGQHASYS